MAKGFIDFLRGGSNNTWHPVKGPVDTTTSSYWLNWRAGLCYLWILTSIAMASYLIHKYEGPNRRRSRNGEEEEEGEDGAYGVMVYDEDAWKPCFKAIHPLWLMVFRVFAFFVLLFIVISNAIPSHGGKIFYCYTDLTLALLIIYFGFGSLLSMYRCYHHHIGFEDRGHPRQVSGFWGYSFQIIYQMVAGAVLLTDCVFWFISVPILVTKESYKLNFLSVTLHTINVVFLLGDVTLNSLRFPWFRIAYFILWTCTFVIFQWVFHACIYFWWPYPFLDLSSLLSPLWYLLVALLHVLCYGIFFLVVKLKNFLLLKILLQDG